jgi:hypothetical protein
MLCRLYGKKDASKFTSSLIPLIYYCANEGTKFNWADILSNNIAEAIAFVKNTEANTFPSFHMSSYLLDIMCVAHQYPKMGWAWQPTDPSIHIYCKVLWEHKHRTDYHNICNHFFPPLYEFIFCAPAPCMTKKALSIIKKNRRLVCNGTWYLYQNIWSYQSSPSAPQGLSPTNWCCKNLLTKRLSMELGRALYRNKKDIWPSLPLSIGSYSFASIKQAEDEVNTLLSYGFGEERFRRHDPKKVVREYCIQNKFTWQYTSTFWEEEATHCGAHSYAEVIARRQGQPSSFELLLQDLP